LLTHGLGLTTPYSLGVSVWNFYQTFATVSIEFWLRFEAHIRPTRLEINFLFVTACQSRKEGLLVCETVWFFSWANTRPFDLKFVPFCPIFGGDSYVEFQEKTILEEFFGNFVQTKAILNQNLWNFAVLSAIFILGPYCAEKVHTSTSICCSHPGKEAGPWKNHKKEIGEENPTRFVFGKPVLFTLGLGLTTPYSFGVSVWNFYQTFATVSIEFWLRFEAQIRPTWLGINFLLITARAERKVRLCVKLFNFFRGRILVRLTWNLSRFVPNSVEIITWNFRKKTISAEFFENFVQTKALYQNLWNFALLSAVFILGSYCAEKFHTSTSICCSHPSKEAGAWKYHKTEIEEKNPTRFVFGKTVLFTLGLGLTTPYSFGVSVWNFYQTFATVSIEFWLRFEARIRPTRLAINFLLIIPRAEGRFVCVWNCWIFFVGEYSSVWPEICRVLSQIQWIFLHRISGKNYFGRIFRKFCANQGYPLPKFLTFRPTFCNFYSGSELRWKISHKYFDMLVAPR